MTFMVFKGTECCALECELNKAEAAGEGRSCGWVGVMGYDAALNGMLVSRGGKVGRKCSPGVLPPCEAQGRMGPGQLPHRGELGEFGNLVPPDPPTRTHSGNKPARSRVFMVLRFFYITKRALPARYRSNPAKLGRPWLGSSGPH